MKSIHNSRNMTVEEAQMADAEMFCRLVPDANINVKQA
jgi:hypothetical protein